MKESKEHRSNIVKLYILFIQLSLQAKKYGFHGYNQNKHKEI